MAVKISRRSLTGSFFLRADCHLTLFKGALPLHPRVRHDVVTAVPSTIRPDSRLDPSVPLTLTSVAGVQAVVAAGGEISNSVPSPFDPPPLVVPNRPTAVSAIRPWWTYTFPVSPALLNNNTICIELK
jgi:hypothetical protein